MSCYQIHHYLLSAIPAIGVSGIWWSVPIGWALADLVGSLHYKVCKKIAACGWQTLRGFFDTLKSPLISVSGLFS